MKISVLAAAMAVLSANAAAQPASLEILVEGLNNPRGLAFAPNGDLYIAESGVGGGDNGLCFPAGVGMACPAQNGAVAVLRRNGAFERPRTDLYSGAAVDGTEAAGPADIVALGAKNIAVTIGFGADPAFREFLEDNDIGGFPGALVRIAGESPVRAIADIADNEAAFDPDMAGADTNPFGLAYDAAREVFLVADSAANALIEVRGRQTRTVAVFPPAPNPLPFGPPFYQSVPTDVIVGPDGAYYVSELTGFPFVAGAANIYRVLPNGAKSVWAAGFTNIISIAPADDGLYVVELASGGLLNGPIGSVIFTPWENPAARTVIASGLFAPGGAAVSDDGDIYITLGALLPGGGALARIPAP